jgi:hypothetical protein
MIDRHDFRDHRLEAAKLTGDRYARERSWCIVPEPEKPTVSVRVVLGCVIAATVLFVFTPVIVRALMS